MDRWLVHTARVLGTALGAFAGVVGRAVHATAPDGVPAGPPRVLRQPRRRADRCGARGTDRLRFAVLGDSTTAGVGVERAEDALPYLIAQRVADAESRSVHVVSYGWAGARVADLARSQLPRALEPLRSSQTRPFLPDADLVAVVIGSNDATHNTPPGRFRSDMRGVLEGVRAAAPNARVVLAGIPAFRGALRAHRAAHLPGRPIRPPAPADRRARRRTARASHMRISPGTSRSSSGAERTSCRATNSIRLPSAMPPGPTSSPRRSSGTRSSTEPARLEPAGA